MNCSSKAKSFYFLCYSCGDLRYIDMSKLDITNIESTTGMFTHCNNVEGVDEWKYRFIS